MLVVRPLKAIVADNGCSWLPPVRRERKFPLLGDMSAPSPARLPAQAQSRIDSGEPLIPYRCRDGVAARANGERRRGNAVRRLGVNAATAPATVSGKSAPNATDGLVFRDPREGRRGRPSRESGDLPPQAAHLPCVGRGRAKSVAAAVCQPVGSLARLCRSMR
jgi:hypothetical protein